jgi:hydroxypyruvate reductase/glycerate 2-kinase
LIISDVIGDPLDVIASGPTAPDPTTFAQALEVLHELGVASRAPESVMRYLHAGRDGKMSETLKSSPRPEPGLMNRVIANNRLALDAAGARARHLGYEVVDLGDKLAGDTLELAKQFAARFEDWRKQAPVCVLSGGETTVRLPSAHGKGGRNQSMALALMESLGPAGLKAATILCGGTDGEDGPTDAAGAFADDMVRDESAQLGLNPSQALFQHDAYPFFEATGGLFRTGLTNTNVMDLRVFLIG